MCVPVEKRDTTQHEVKMKRARPEMDSLTSSTAERPENNGSLDGNGDPAQTSTSRGSKRSYAQRRRNT